MILRPDSAAVTGPMIVFALRWRRYFARDIESWAGRPGEGGHSGIAVFERQIQSLEMSLLVLSLSIAVASNEIIAQPKMKTAIGSAER